MLLKYYSRDLLISQLKSVIGKYLDLNEYQILAFGSRVSGKASDHSDIDIGLLGPRPIFSQTLGAIKDEIEELPILYKIDIIDFKSASADFNHIALQHYEII